MPLVMQPSLAGPLRCRVRRPSEQADAGPGPGVKMIRSAEAEPALYTTWLMDCEQVEHGLPAVIATRLGHSPKAVRRVRTPRRPFESSTSTSEPAFTTAPIRGSSGTRVSPSSRTPSARPPGAPWATTNVNLSAADSRCRPLAIQLTAGQAGTGHEPFPGSLASRTARITPPSRTRRIPPALSANMCADEVSSDSTPCGSGCHRKRRGHLWGKPPAFDCDADKQHNTLERCSTGADDGAAWPRDPTRPQPSTSPHSTPQASSSGPRDDPEGAPEGVSGKSCAVLAVSGACSRCDGRKSSYRTYLDFRAVRRQCVPGAVSPVQDFPDMP
ncbi:hypothetical protein DSC45_05220 [Streptomyces sp. YIM 130001]|nr:hypothetical protein DSC45_05220 [Streptomyces sp. YIM 130001]